MAEEWEFLSDPATEYKFVIRHVLKLHGQDALWEHDKTRFETR